MSFVKFISLLIMKLMITTLVLGYIVFMHAWIHCFYMCMAYTHEIYIMHSTASDFDHEIYIMDSTVSDFDDWSLCTML